MKARGMSSITIPRSHTGAYVVDPTHSRIGVAVRQALVSIVSGTFSRFAGSGYLDVENPSMSHLSLTIDATSIDTGNARRDTHLRSRVFLDVARYPGITFGSTSVEKIGPADYRVTGDLTIRVVTEPVSVGLECTGADVDSLGNHRMWFEGETIIDRRDWLIPRDTVGGVLISRRATVKLEVALAGIEAD